MSSDYVEHLSVKLMFPVSGVKLFDVTQAPCDFKKNYTAVVPMSNKNRKNPHSRKEIILKRLSALIPMHMFLRTT